MSDWWTANGRGCAECRSPAAWCRACTAEADAARLRAETTRLAAEVSRLTGAGYAAMNPATVAEIIAQRDALAARVGELESELCREVIKGDDLQAEADDATASRDSLAAKLGECERLKQSLSTLKADCIASYGGGHKTPDELEIFRHGMATVCNVVEANLSAIDSAPAGKGGGVKGRNHSAPWSKKTLRAFVSRGILTIEIGIDTLAWATLHSDYVSRLEGPPVRDHSERYRIDDPRVFAKDVLHEMLDEAEDGSNLLNMFLDKACEQAIEQGSIAFVDTEES